MTAPAIPAARKVADAPHPGRSWGQVVEVWFRAHATLVYLFLYLPILIVVVFSFNANRLATIWTGFSTEWYGVALGDRTVQRALVNSFLIAVPNAVLATIFGTMAALGLQRVSKGVRIGFDGLTYVSIIVPEVVIALSTLVLFASAFDVINPTLIALQGGDDWFKLGLGHFTIIAAHMLFNISLVLLLVRARLSGMDRSLVDASADLFATPWRTFRQIAFPAAAGHRRGLPPILHVLRSMTTSSPRSCPGPGRRRCRCSSSDRSSAASRRRRTPWRR